MNLNMGSQLFENVEIPILWGDRAILQDKIGRLSVISLAGDMAKLEIVGDEPAPDVNFRPLFEGFVIIDDESDLYSYVSKTHTLSSISLKLPDIYVNSSVIRVGSTSFRGNQVSGSGVGIHVWENGVSLGEPLPERLAKLKI